MKTLAALLFLFAAAVLRAGESQPFVFSGVLHEHAATQVALTAAAGGASKWVEVGQQFGGYDIVSFDESAATLLVRQGAREYQIKLQEVIIKPPAALDPALSGKIRNNLRLLWAAAQQFFIETGKTTATFADLVGEEKTIKALESVSGEDYTSLVINADARGLSVRTMSGETVSFAEALYAIKPGDTGAKIARDNHVTLTDLVALNPDVDWKKLKAGQVVNVSPASK